MEIRRYGPDQPYAECYATLMDGVEALVNVQYEVILPHGKHAAGCDQVEKIGGRCTCERYAPWAGREQEVIDAARAWLQTQREPSSDPGPASVLHIPTRNDNPYMAKDRTRPCSICDSYCYGDCAS